MRYGSRSPAPWMPAVALGYAASVLAHITLNAATF